MTNNYIFNDGSLESQVVQHQVKGIVVTVPKYTKLDNWLGEILEEDDEIKIIHLHFCYEQMTPGIRAEISNALHNYPYIRIALPLENMDKRSLNNKAKALGIFEVDPDYKLENVIESTKHPFTPSGVVKDDIDKLMEENKDKIKVVDYGKYRVGGDYTQPIGKEVTNDIIEPDNVVPNDKFIDKIKEFKDKRRRKKKQ